MRILVTGSTGVLGRACVPRLQQQGHEVATPGREELDLFDPAAVGAAVRGCDAVLHLATRIPPPDHLGDPQAWRDNDLLRAVASGLLVDAAIAASAAVYVQPTVTFVYPADGPVDETTPVRDVGQHLRSALLAEAHAARFVSQGRRGIVLRLGLLDGPGTGNDHPVPALGATLHVDDAGTAVAAALQLDSGIYNVCRDGERVVNTKFRTAARWSPQR